jgi:large subunit ribosomal protein L4
MSEDINIKVVSREGTDAGQIALTGGIFNKQVKEGVLHEVVVWQLAKRRQGTHKCKTRSEVARSKSKPWKQKGTGRARAGSRTSPVWVGGGVSHGPSPRSYGGSVPKKVREAALKGALSDKVRQDRVRVIDGFGELSGKTAEVAGILRKLGVYQEPVLVVSAGHNEALRRASRNIPGALVLPVEGLNVYDILRSRHVLIEKESIALIEQRLKGRKVEEVQGE